MMVLLFGLGALLLAFVAQVAIVRTLRPKNHAAVIVAVFGVFSFAALVLFAMWPRPEPPVVPVWADVARLALLLASISLAYIAVYSAIEDDSPSMAMVKMAWQAGDKGCAESDFRAVMDDRLFLDRRIDAMERDGWVDRSGGNLILTPLGRLWATVFFKAQLVLGMDEGG